MVIINCSLALKSPYRQFQLVWLAELIVAEFFFIGQTRSDPSWPFFFTGRRQKDRPDRVQPGLTNEKEHSQYNRLKAVSLCDYVNQGGTNHN